MTTLDQPTASSWVVPVALPLVGEPEAEAARRTILTGCLMHGPQVEAFEAEFAAFVGSTYACAVSNGAAAVHLGLLAVGVRPGDEVITVSQSFVATANGVRYCGATPVFVDVDPGTFTMDPRLIEQAITPRTRAILCVHSLGMPCDLTEIVRIGRRHGLGVVEDCASAAGSEILWGGQWQKVGRPQGDVACFSFHPQNVITTGDGGMITTNESEWDRLFRRLRLDGISVSTAVHRKPGGGAHESRELPRSHCRMTEIQAAIGLEQLKRLPEIVMLRRALAQRYDKFLADVRLLGLPDEPSWARSNWQSYCVRLPDGVDQQAVMHRMLERGVSTRRGITCAHREPAYRTQTWSCGLGPGICGCGAGSCSRLFESERAQDRCIAIPLFPHMTHADQGRVAEELRAAVMAATRGALPAAPTAVRAVHAVASPTETPRCAIR